jgi:DDE superfamily endonuclease
MFEYDSLTRYPRAFRSLTGMTPVEFDSLLADFTSARQRLCDRSRTTRRGQPRQRAAGAGHPFAHDDRHRLLMALVWLRIYPTYELLGFFFALHKRNAQLNVRAVLAVLDTLDDFPFDRPGSDRRKLRTADQVMTAFPQVRLVIDGKEQRVQRPHESYEAQKPYYSGKKKAHTVKTQIAVGPDGVIESVGESVPGGATHDLTLLRESRLLDELAAGEGGMVDKGYDGIAKDHPEVPIVIPFKARRNRPLTEEEKAFNKVVAGYRIVVEHALAQLNRFTVLRQVFRGRHQKHKKAHSRVVRVVARLVNRRTRVCPLKTYAPAA